jgi:hypothetical protein
MTPAISSTPAEIMGSAMTSSIASSFVFSG